MIEMSAHCSEAMTRAGTGSSPRNSTVMFSIVWTTCAAVATFPSGEISTPEPISLKPTVPSAVTSWPRARITTTDVLTRRYASWSDSPSPGDGAANRSASASITARRPSRLITAPPT